MLGSITVLQQCVVRVGERERAGGREGDRGERERGRGREAGYAKGTMQFVVSLFIG